MGLLRFFPAVLLLSCTFSLAAPAATPASTAEIAASYSLTKTGWGSANRVTDPGTVYTIRTDGLLARAIADHVTPTNNFVGGKLEPPAKGFRAAFGASGDVSQVQPGQRFYLHDVELKDDAVFFTMLSLDSMNVVAQGTSTHSRVRMYLRFALTKEQRGQLTSELVHQLTDPVFAPESAVPKIQLGQSAEEVQKQLGTPDHEVDLGGKKILVYKTLKITLIDDKVTDAD